MTTLIIAGAAVMLIGCATSSSEVAESTAEPRSSAHSAALAESLVQASTRAQANGITRSCDFGYSTGQLDGAVKGREAFRKATATHCLGAVTPAMMESSVKRAAGDPKMAMQALEEMCNGPPDKPAPTDKYGEGLLLVTQKCDGNQECALTLQGTYMKCYTAGLNEAFAAGVSSALEFMLKTCSTFKTEGTACQESAQNIAQKLKQ